MNGIRVEGIEYEPTKRMEAYQDYMEQAVWHIDQARHELDLAETQLNKMFESGQMDVYSTIAVHYRDLVDRLATAVTSDFEAWKMDEQTVANHHFWSELDDSDE